MKRVAIIISTYNQEELLKITLNSVLKKTNYKNYKIFVMDDSGKGEIAKNIKKEFKKVTLIVNENNLGFSKSNNIGIKRAIEKYNPDYLLLLNDDTEVVQRDWLKKMIEVGESDENIGILGGKIIYPDGSLQNIGGYLRKWEIVKELDENKKDVFEVDHVMGAFMLVKKRVVDKIGMLDENYSPYLLEDTDYCLNAKRNGFKIVSVPYVKIIHKKGKSIDSLENKDILKVRMKNDIYFSIKNLNGKNKLFRIFVYLPMVAIFKKKNDEAELRLRNLKLRKDFIVNMFILVKSYFYTLFKAK